jgi:hypothetical protein
MSSETQESIPQHLPRASRLAVSGALNDLTDLEREDVYALTRWMEVVQDPQGRIAPSQLSDLLEGIVPDVQVVSVAVEAAQRCPAARGEMFGYSEVLA